MEAAAPYIFVTVGTTSFDDLVRAVVQREFAAAAAKAGFPRILVQIGRGGEPGALDPTLSVTLSGPADAPTWAFHVEVPPTSGGRGGRVAYTAYRFKPSISGDVAGAGVVVSHAGAGSVFETLRAGVPLLVAINTALAGNHQVELAEAMAARGHLLHGTPADVHELLGRVQGARLAPLPPLDRGPCLRALSAVLRGAPPHE